MLIMVAMDAGKLADCRCATYFGWRSKTRKGGSNGKSTGEHLVSIGLNFRSAERQWLW
jgi:hypothetical protein